MRSTTSVKPTIVHLTPAHKNALEVMKARTSKTMKRLIQEGIEDLAVKYGLVQDRVVSFGLDLVTRDPVNVDREEVTPAMRASTTQISRNWLKL